MDILHLVDRLEELFNESRPIPLTNSVIVDEDRILDLIDQMRVTIPDEVKKSQQILSQRDRIIAQAEEKANRILALAHEKGEHLLQQSSLIQAAQIQADEVKSKSRSDAERARRDADKYVIDALVRLEYELEKLLNQARNGILALQNFDEPHPSTKMPDENQAKETE